MVQMPVHPTRDWKSSPTSSYTWTILDFSNKPAWWDEDLARCFLQYQLKQGAVLRVKIETNGDCAISLDGRLIQGAQNKEMIRDIIQPLRDEMRKKIFDVEGLPDSDHWYSSLPGVTKIKIYMRTVTSYAYPRIYSQGSICYVTQHKMGRNGGKNYHITGIIKSLKRDG